MEGYAYIELNHRFYYVYCPADNSSAVKVKALRKFSQSVPGSSGKDTEMFWRYPEVNIDMVALPRADLVIFRDPVQQQALAQELIDGMHRLWIKAREHAVGAAQI